MNERRRYSRLDFTSQSVLVCQGRKYSTRLIDISMKGALIDIPGEWSGKPGLKGDLEILLTDSNITIIMKVEVAHVDEETLGLRCYTIDLDSMTHLRRLLELNLGDPKLVERELFMLG